MDFFLAAIQAALQLIIQFDHELYSIVLISLKLSCCATLLATLIGVFLGIVIAINQFPGKQLIQQLLNTLMAMPTVMIGLIFYGLLGRQGPLGYLGLLYTEEAVIIGETCLVLPLIINSTRVAVQSADPRLLITLQILGASRSQQLIPILRELQRPILAGVITGFGRAIGEVGAAMMLGGNIQGLTRTMTTAIALETSKGNFELGLALGLLLLSLAFVINLLLQQLHHNQQ